jgi:hypothetical protein
LHVQDEHGEQQPDEIGRRYLSLALHLDRHFQGLVDAYFGPPELKAQAEAGDPRPLDAMASDARQLQQAIEASDYDPQRKDYLTLHTRAMQAIIGKLSGDVLSIEEEAAQYFDIAPEMVDESVLEEFRAQIDSLLPGKGALAGRVLNWDRRSELRVDRILPVCERVIEEARARTRALFDLPLGEEVSLSLVQHKPWKADNWFLGHGRSQIDLNCDLGVRIEDVVTGIPHETYPGHHTELAIKERLLWRGEGRAEHSLLVTGPQAVVAEGLAVWAWEIIFEGGELVDFLRRVLYPLAGLPTEDVELDIAVMRAKESVLGAVDGNASLMLHRDGRTAEEVQQYLVHFGLLTPQRAAKALEFMLDPLWRAYTFNYAAGRKLLTPLLSGPDRLENLARLLSEPFTPTQVRQWVAQRDAGGR